MTLRFLHFSDIHFGQEKNGEWEPYDDVRREALADVRRVRSDGTIKGPADGILISGDIAQAGREEEFKTASAWLDDVITASGCTRNSVRMVPGNHDINLASLGSQGVLQQKMLRATSLSEIASYLAAIADKAEEPIWAKFSEYRSFAYAYGSDFYSHARPLVISHYELPGGRGIRLVGLCTVMLSDRSDVPGNIILGANQYQLSREDGYEDIYMMHHPPQWLRDRVEAEEYLNSRARLLVTGHEHRPALAKVEHESGLQQIQLAAGSTTPPNNEAGYNYSYNWIEVEWDGSQAVPQLAVTVYPRVWNATETRFAADYGRCKGSVSRRISLDCEPFKPAEEVFVSSLCPANSEASAKELSLPEPTGSETLRLPDTDEVGTIVGDAEAFEKLRFLFWRYLSRPDRVSILIDLGLLTEAARRRAPAAIERQAFEDAAQLGRLGTLWDRVMPSVPLEERGSNPFKDA